MPVALKNYGDRKNSSFFNSNAIAVNSDNNDSAGDYNSNTTNNSSNNNNTYSIACLFAFLK